MGIKSRKSFTLIELLVVVAVIAILASVLLPALNKALEKARQVTCVNIMKSLGMANQAYFDNNNGVIMSASPEIGVVCIMKQIRTAIWLPFFMKFPERTRFSANTFPKPGYRQNSFAKRRLICSEKPPLTLTRISSKIRLFKT